MRLWQRIKAVLGLKERCACGACTSWTPGILERGIFERGTIHTRRRCGR